MNARPAVVALLLLAAALPPAGADSPEAVVSGLRGSLETVRLAIPDPGDKTDAARRKALLKADAALALPPLDLAAACKSAGKAAKAVAKPLAGNAAVDDALAAAGDGLEAAAGDLRDAYADLVAESLSDAVTAKGSKTLASVDASLGAADQAGILPVQRFALLGKAAKSMAGGRKAFDKASGGPPAYGRLFFADYLSSRISVFDAETGTLVEAVNPLSYLASTLVVDPALSRNRVYVMGEQQLLTLDARTLKILRRDDGLGDYGVHQARVLGDRLYIAANGGGNGYLVVRNLRTNAWETPIPVAYYPYALAVDPVEGRLWVNGFGTSTVQVVEAATGNILASPVVGQYPRGMALDPVTRRAFTARNQSQPNPGGTYLGVVSMDTLAKTADMWLGDASYGAEAVATDVVRRRLYVLNNRNPYLNVGNLVVLDLDSLAILHNEQLDDNPKEACVDPATGLVYITTSEGIQVYNPGTGSLETPLPDTGSPWGASIVR